MGPEGGIWRRRRRAALTAVAIAAVVAAAAPATAYPRPGQTQLISAGVDGTKADNYSDYASLSADGRFVAYDSQASNLVDDDNNGTVNDIFLTDRLTGATQRVSVTSAETGISAPSYLARIDGSGRHVIFSSSGSLVPGTPAVGSVYLRDVAAGTTELISTSSQGEPARSVSFPGDITPGGRFVVFDSFADNIAAGDHNNKSDVFVRDRMTGTTERISLRTDGRERVGDSMAGTISDDGRYVAYVALVGTMGDDNATFIDEMQIFRFDRVTGDVRLVSQSSESDRANGFSSDPQISGDGRLVFFASQAQNLVPSDSNRVEDLFVRDMVDGTTERVNVTSAGAEVSGETGPYAISPDGRFVALISGANDLADGDTNGRKDVFVRDRLAGTTERVSIGSAGEQAETHSESPHISADGRYVAFSSYSDGLVPGDANESRDIFVRDRGPALGVQRLGAARVGEAVAVEGSITLSGVVVAERRDQAGDAVHGGAELGADLLGASLTLRPETEDLLVRLDVASLPGARPPQAPGLAIGCALGFACAAGAAGVPGIAYGLRFRVADAEYEVRVERGVPLAAPVATLASCDAVCTPVATLDGVIGTTGNQILVRMPLETIGATGAATISEIRAFTGGAAATVDDVQLPNAHVAPPRVAVAVTPQQSSDPNDFVEVDAAAGSFSSTLAAPWTGAARVWTRVCLADACTTATRDMD